MSYKAAYAVRRAAQTSNGVLGLSNKTNVVFNPVLITKSAEPEIPEQDALGFRQTHPDDFGK